MKIAKMKLTPKQFNRFWSKRDGWPAIVSARGWDHAKAEEERHALLLRAGGFHSLKEVDPGRGFTAVLKELATLRDDLGGMLRADANQRRQIIWTLTHTFSPESWAGMAKLRFGTADLEQLSDAELVQLRDTVCDRNVEQHHDSTVARRRAQARHRRATAEPPARISLPAPEPSQGEPSAEESERSDNDCGGYYCSEEHGHIDCQDKPSPVLTAMTTGEEDNDPF